MAKSDIPPLDAVAKDELLDVLAHELRSPLAAVLGWAEVLANGVTPEQIRRAAEVIKRNVALQTRMLDDLVDLQRAARGELSLLDVGQQGLEDLVMSAVEAATKEAAAADVRLTVHGWLDELTVECDAGRLGEVFAKLLNNAIKFTPAGGTVDVEIARADSDAVVTIVDSGEGIAADVLPLVFETFRRPDAARARRSGLGVGLKLVRHLVEAHGGEVEVESEGEDRGTTVTVRLPLATERKDADGSDTQAQVARAEAPLRGVSVLAVEDVDESREVTRLVLEQLGARVSEARDGNEALDAVAKCRPDVVLCDLRMPNMDGYTFLCELRRRFEAGPPVIVATGLVARADEERTREAGFAGCVRKPLDWNELVDVVRSALGR